MSEGNGKAKIYQLSISGAVSKEITAQYERAKTAALAGEFKQSLIHIFHRLKHDPLDFGEPLFHYASSGLQLRHAIVAPILVEYAVHPDRPFVILRSITFRPKGAP